MPEDTTTEAWREHARKAYAAGADERLGEATADEKLILDADYSEIELRVALAEIFRPKGEFGSGSITGRFTTRRNFEEVRRQYFAEDQG